MTTFSILYATHGPDTELIAKKLRIKPSSVDRLINKAMDEKYALKAKRRADNARIRAELREIRARHAV
jgi:DNA-binding MarR family transcriptional regulator